MMNELSKAKSKKVTQLQLIGTHVLVLFAIDTLSTVSLRS